MGGKKKKKKNIPWYSFSTTHTLYSMYYHYYYCTAVYLVAIKLQARSFIRSCCCGLEVGRSVGRRFRLLHDTSRGNETPPCCTLRNYVCPRGRTSIFCAASCDNNKQQCGTIIMDHGGDNIYLVDVDGAGSRY